MSDFSLPERANKIDRVLARRQPALTVVLENIHDAHNVNAILRSCDATGVLRVHLLYTIESFPRLELSAARGADKWIEYERHSSVADCVNSLRKDNFQLLATAIDPSATPLYDLDLTTPTAFLLGNEHRGISDELRAASDRTVFIPMMGMVESLNVSVATAVCLFEALRQRRERGLYDAPQLSAEALRSKRIEWQLK